MLDNLTLTITIIAIAGSGVVAGIFFAFSAFVMKALSQVPAPYGMAAMQRINVTVINPFFMAVFLGTPVASLYLVIIGIINISDTGAGYLISGGGVHIIGSLLVTIGFNVPRNNALADVHADSEDASRIWSKYLKEWTTWNHVRSVSSLASAVLLSLALL